MTSLREVLPIRRHESLIERGAHRLTELQDEINRLFHDFTKDMEVPGWMSHMRSPFGQMPAVDIAETGKEFKVTAEIPGMEAKDIDVSIANGYLRLKGEKRQENEEEKEGCYRYERSYGTFERTVVLPETAHLDKAEASMNKGVLTISIPKRSGAQAKERKLDIRQAA